MFGTIGRARLKPGHDGQFQRLNDEWRREIRPKVPGAFMELVGHRAGRPDEIVFVALAEDEQTYRTLAEMPEQHAFFQRMSEHLQAEPSWEDVELEIAVND